MYKKRFNDKFNKKYEQGQFSIKEREDAGIPTKPSMSSNSNFLSKTAYRNLRLDSITTKANPTAEAVRSGKPYSITDSTNQVWEAEYPGESNLAGNTIPLLVNSNDSALLNCFDCAKLDIMFKYLYAAIDANDINQALNVQLGKSVTEALSRASSETYTQLPFFNSFEIQSSMENCDEKKLTQALIWYQTMLQNIAIIPGKYNLVTSLEQHLKDSCYNRNVAPLDDLFGLLRKNSFRAKINAFSNMITGEYFDLSWFKQVNTLSMVPSRKSDAMRDPLLIIDGYYDVPDLLMTNPTTNVTAIDSNNYGIKLPVGAPYYSTEKVRFEVGIHSLITLLSPYNILKWSRQVTEGLTTTTPTQYFNTIVDVTDALRAVLIRFPSDVADMRTALDTANRVGLNRWTRGVYFDVTKEMNYEPVFNKLCNDVFVNYLASPNKIYYDNHTLRYKFYSLWNEYLGIPKFDQVNGGAFLSFSTRQFDSSITPSTNIQYLIPKLFDIPSAGYSDIEIVNRLGLTATIGYQVYDANAIESSTIYNRLNGLKFADFAQRIPYANIAEGYNNIPEVGSAIYLLLTRLFNLGNIRVSDSVINETLNSEIVSAIDIEMDDISNAMITFAQAYAPFKVYTQSSERTMGFKNIPTVM